MNSRMARAKKKPSKQPLVIRSITLSRDNDNVLGHLRQEASDALGWTVSSSATVRALIQYVKQQPPSWVSTTLFPIIEQEIAQGRVWGSKKK